jgi:hypothetical protein
LLDATAFDDTATVQSLPAFPVTLDGGKGNNTLVGPDIDNTWQLAQPSGVQVFLCDFLIPTRIISRAKNHCDIVSSTLKGN